MGRVASTMTPCENIEQIETRVRSSMTQKLFLRGSDRLFKRHVTRENPIAVSALVFDTPDSPVPAPVELHPCESPAWGYAAE